MPKSSDPRKCPAPVSAVATAMAPVMGASQGTGTIMDAEASTNAVYLGKRIRIAIVDNDKLTLGMMKLMIRQLLPLAEILWTTPQGRTAVRQCLEPKTRPDVLLVDMSLEDMTGCDVCHGIRARTPQVVLVGVTSFALERYYAPALENGAACLMDKAKIRDICRAVCLLANGESPHLRYEATETARHAYERLSATATSDLPQSQQYRSLTARETEVMNLCARGYTSKEIGDALDIGETTVKTYIRRVTEKMHARNRTQAVIRWLEMKE